MPKDPTLRFFCLVEGCGTSVSRKSDLSRHYRDKHATAPKEYTCPHCCFSTTQKGNLTTHQRRHYGVVLKCPFKEKGCTYETTHASALSRHKRLEHTVAFFATKEAYASARPCPTRPRNKHITMPRRICDDESSVAEPLFFSFTPKDDPGLVSMTNLPPFDPYQHPWNELVKPIEVSEDDRASSVISSGFSDTEGAPSSSSSSANESEESREASPFTWDRVVAQNAPQSPTADGQGTWTWTVEDPPTDSDASKSDPASGSTATMATTEEQSDSEEERRAVWNSVTPVPPSPSSRRTSPSLTRVPTMAVIAPSRHLRECDDVETEIEGGTEINYDFWQGSGERTVMEVVPPLPYVPASAIGEDEGYEEETSSQAQLPSLEEEPSQSPQAQEQQAQGQGHPLAFFNFTSAIEPQRYFIPSDDILRQLIDLDTWPETLIPSTESTLAAANALFDYASYAGHVQEMAAPQFSAPAQNLEVRMGRIDYGMEGYSFPAYEI